MHALSAFSKLEGVQISGMQVLSRLCTVAQGEQVFMDAGGLSAVLSAMQVQKPSTAKFGCIILRSLAQGGRVAMQGTFLASGGVPLLCAIMRAYPACAVVQSHASCIIFYMSAHDQHAKVSQAYMNSTPVQLVCGILFRPCVH